MRSGKSLRSRGFASLTVELSPCMHAGCRQKEKAANPEGLAAFEKNPGSDLLSHAVTRTVPSAVAGLTSVFGMGMGVTLLL